MVAKFVTFPKGANQNFCLRSRARNSAALLRVNHLENHNFRAVCLDQFGNPGVVRITTHRAQDQKQVAELAVSNGEKAPRGLRLMRIIYSCGWKICTMERRGLPR